MTRALLFDAPGPPGPTGARGPMGPSGPPGPDWVFNAKNYGCIGDGIVDDTAGIRALVAAAKAGSVIGGKLAGVKLYFPHGVYLCSEQINFDTIALNASGQWPNTVICGDGPGVIGNGNRGPSTLIYTGTGSTSFISARSTSQFTMLDISVLYSSGSYTGTLIDCGGYVSVNIETINATFINVNMGCDAAAYSTAAAMLSLDGCLNSIVENCHIAGAVAGIYITAHNNIGANNSTLIRTTAFGPGITGSAIYNPGFDTTVLDCSFENTPFAVAVNSTSRAQVISGFNFTGNWMGDADAFYANAWCDPGDWLWCGAAFIGNTFGQVARGPTDPQHDSIKLGSCQGVTITGNTLVTVDFSLVVGGSYPQGVTITGNQLNGGDTAGAPYWRGLRAYSTGVNIYSNYPNGFNQSGAQDLISLGGHIITYPSLLTQPTTTATTNATAVIDGSATVGSNDTAGRITLTVSSTGTAIGTQCSLIFAQAFDSVGGTPKALLMPENAATAALAASIYTSPSTTGFDIKSASTVAAGTYKWAYWVIQ